MDQRVYPSGVPSVDYTYKPDPGGRSGVLSPTDFIDMAKQAVAEYYNSYLPGSSVHKDDVFVVWFNKALQNWKATASTIYEDDRYFELTYNGDKRELYVDEYVKKGNRVMYLTHGPAPLTD